ncbi:MAG: DUF962 domain-containing protein [Actinomycetia bacterium]|nr:DUF962 domain-containing protein [Actinomycetes bacterium]
MSTNDQPVNKATSDQPATLEFADFAEFFPFYMSQHSKRATRMMHCVGTSMGLGIALPSALWGPRRRVLLGAAVGYGFAWTSHFAIEKNRPASFGHPLWSFLGDWKMIAMMLAGRDNEISEIAANYLADAAAADGTST